MTKQEYIEQLKKLLTDLSQEELQDAILFVSEYFEEAGVGNEDKVYKELGSPRAYAAIIKADSTLKGTNVKLDEMKEEQKKTSGYLKTMLIIVVAIFALPIGLPIVITLFVLLLTLFIVLASLLFALVCSIVALIIAGVGLLFGSFGLLSVDVAGGISALGSSIVVLALAILFIALFYSIVVKFIPFLTRQLGKLFGKLRGTAK